MRYIIGIITICVALVALSSCNGDKQFEQCLETMDSLMREQPDSAYHVLLGMRSEACHQGKQQRMHYELSLADAQNKAYVDFVTDSVMKTVADYYDDHGTPNQQMRAYYLLGCTYRDMNDVPMELQFFQKATEVADTTDKDCDLYTLISIYGQMADLYEQQCLPNEELSVLYNCETLARKSGDTFTALKAFKLRIRPHALLCNYDSIIQIANKANKLFEEYGDEYEAVTSFISAISVFIDKKEYDIAKHYMNILESGLRKSEKRKIKGNYLYDKGRLLLFDGKIDSAKYCFETLFEIGNDEAAYRGLLSVYQKLNLADSVIKYSELFANANDSSYIRDNSANLSRMTAMYNYARYQKVAEEQAEMNVATNRKNQLLTIYLFFSVLVIFAIVRLISNQKKEAKRNYDAMLKRYNSVIKEKTELVERQNILIQEKEKTSTQKSQIEMELQLLQQTITTLNEEIDSMHKIDNDVDFNAWIASFADSDIVRRLQTLVFDIRPGHNNYAKQSDWSTLKDYFESKTSFFISSVTNNNNFNELDQKVIMLTILGFKNNEMAILLNLSAQHISNTRKRVYCRLFPTGNNVRELRKELLDMLKNERTHSS